MPFLSPATRLPRACRNCSTYLVFLHNDPEARIYTRSALKVASTCFAHALSKGKLYVRCGPLGTSEKAGRMVSPSLLFVFAGIMCCDILRIASLFNEQVRIDYRLVSLLQISMLPTLVVVDRCQCDAPPFALTEHGFLIAVANVPCSAMLRNCLPR